MQATLNTVSATLKPFYATCCRCEGEGQLEAIHHYGLTGMQCERYQDCPECDGEGVVEVPCPECDGEGVAEDDDGIERPCPCCA